MGMGGQCTITSSLGIVYTFVVSSILVEVNI